MEPAAGTRACDGLVADVLRDLLSDARALGSTAVSEVKFRNRWPGVAGSHSATGGSFPRSRYTPKRKGWR